MLHVLHLVSVKTLNTLVKRTSPHSVVTKKMYTQISSVHGSSVLTVSSSDNFLKNPHCSAHKYSEGQRQKANLGSQLLEKYNGLMDQLLTKFFKI